MAARPFLNLNHRAMARQHAALSAKKSRLIARQGKRARGTADTVRGPYMPPEDWFSPSEGGTSGYRVIRRAAGEGYRHVVTPEEIRQRLSLLPREFLQPLEVVQLSSMTRKKRSFPCYGMQWGTTVYLYPIEEELVEYFPRAPRPAMQIEARMYGGRWEQEGGTSWRLIWTEQAIKDFYLNNVLIHELGHLLDNRNNSYADRERFAEWFALEYGYRRSVRPGLARRAADKVTRRHG